MTSNDIVIVGGGLAALRAAERLRSRGFAGFITMVGDETQPPYNRPPLSKQMLTGRMRESDLGFQTFTRLAVTMRSGQRATGLDPVRRRVRLDTGEDIPYGRLLIATGVRPRQLPGVPVHDERVATLRTLQDFRTFNALLRGARRVAVVGGGFIGCEVAASLRQRSMDVTLIDVAPVLLQRVLGQQLGASLTEVHRRAGVDLRLGTGVENWSTNGSGINLELRDGSTARADVVLVAVGTAPVVDWLTDSGIDTTDGVLCDATCHVAGIDDAVAAGDVARWPNARFGREARRVEHWINAVEHGQAAADSLLDGRVAARAYTPIPRFWSEQHGVRIQSVGMPAIADRVELVQGQLERLTFVAACFRTGRMVGALGFNSPRAMLRFADLIDAANPVPVTATGVLASPYALQLS
jgi:NADPH-dependent 2,4-dienoyl-CoA reductase/sulfur reductase-like enzyme